MAIAAIGPLGLHEPVPGPPTLRASLSEFFSLNLGRFAVALPRRIKKPDIFEQTA